jgi:2-hydroxychromene-2-carboxylate isomerase
MARKGEFDDAALSAAAPGLGLDGAALLAAMQKDEVKAMVRDDVHAGDGFPTLRIGVPPGIFSIPTIFVNERYLPRWMRGDKNVLPYILEHTPAR